MAKQPTLTDVGSGFLSAAAINANNDAIEDAFDNTLSRDGSTPNQMEADLDMNSNDILNISELSAQSIVLDGETLTTSVASLTAEQSAKLGFSTRSQANAEAAAALTDGTVVKMAGLAYVVDSTATGADSATNDLSVDGLRPFGATTPNHFGAVGDGTTDDTDALQATIDYVTSVGWGSVIGIPGQTYAVNSGLTLDGDHIRLYMPHNKIVNNSVAGADLFTMGITMNTRFCDIIIGEIIHGASAGHVLVPGEDFAVTALTWNVREVFQQNVNKSIIKGTYAGAGGVFDSRFYGGYWFATSSQAVPLMDILADSGRFAANTIRINRVTPNAGALAVRPFRFRCSSASTYLFTNVLEETNFEVCDGGIVELAGCRNWVLRDLWAFDNGMSISDDMILLTNDGASGLDCVAITIDNYTRTQGAFAGTSYDIHTENSDGTYIKGGNGDGGTGLLLNCGNNSCVIVDPGEDFTLTSFNAGNSTYISSGSDAGVMTDKLEARKVVVAKGTELTIASGAITVLDSFHTVDTESDAASDDLDTINGGETGMRLVLEAANAGRSVVVKDGTGNLRLAGDFTMDNTLDLIELINSGGVWVELTRSDNAA